MKLQGAFT